MKKYIILIFILSISLGTGIYGQNKNSKQKGKDTSSSKKSYAPKKGYYTAAITFGRGAYSNNGLTAPASFGKVDGTAPFADDISANDNSIVNMVGAEGRYYVSDKIALTLSGGTILRNTPKHLAIPAVTTATGGIVIPGYSAVVADERIDINFTLGGQWTFDTGSKKMFPYLGIALPFNYARRSLYDPTVDIVEGKSIITDLGARHVEIKSFGIQAVAGVDYYLSDDVFIGFRIKPASFNYAFSNKIPGPGLFSLDSDTYTTSFFVQPSFSVGFSLGKKDSDGDGIYDGDDTCPDVAGLAAFNGCPDADGDGVQDSEDACPDVPGVAAFNGCPDTDGDGVQDSKDACLYVAGVAAFNGCPDTDGDGVQDSKDDCPSIAGLSSLNGCPDADGDGVPDKDDKCINEKGDASNDGCPLIITDKASEAVSSYSKLVLFRSGISSFGAGAIEPLNSIITIMSEFSKANFSVEGHTDSTGREPSNVMLSGKRANSVKKYLVSKGINSNRLTTKSHGSAKPVGSNQTNAGRTSNRRIEIKVSNKK